MSQTRKVIVSKLEWEKLLNGQLKSLRIFKESDLHYQFGDNPEEHIVRLSISKTD